MLLLYLKPAGSQKLLFVQKYEIVTKERLATITLIPGAKEAVDMHDVPKGFYRDYMSYYLENKHLLYGATARFN